MGFVVQSISATWISQSREESRVTMADFELRSPLTGPGLHAMVLIGIISFHSVWFFVQLQAIP